MYRIEQFLAQQSKTSAWGVSEEQKAEEVERLLELGVSQVEIDQVREDFQTLLERPAADSEFIAFGFQLGEKYWNDTGLLLTLRRLLSPTGTPHSAEVSLGIGIGQGLGGRMQDATPVFRQLANRGLDFCEVLRLGRPNSAWVQLCGEAFREASPAQSALWKDTDIRDFLMAFLECPGLQERLSTLGREMREVFIEEERSRKAATDQVAQTKIVKNMEQLAESSPLAATLLEAREALVQIGKEADKTTPYSDLGNRLGERLLLSYTSSDLTAMTGGESGEFLETFREFLESCLPQTKRMPRNVEVIGQALFLGLQSAAFQEAERQLKKAATHKMQELAKTHPLAAKVMAEPDAIQRLTRESKSTLPFKKFAQEITERLAETDGVKQPSDLLSDEFKTCFKDLVFVNLPEGYQSEKNRDLFANAFCAGVQQTVGDIEQRVRRESSYHRLRDLGGKNALAAELVKHWENLVQLFQTRNPGNMDYHDYAVKIIVGLPLDQAVQKQEELLSHEFREVLGECLLHHLHRDHGCHAQKLFKNDLICGFERAIPRWKWHSGCVQLDDLARHHPVAREILKQKHKLYQATGCFPESKPMEAFIKDLVEKVEAEQQTSSFREFWPEALVPVWSILLEAARGLFHADKEAWSTVEQTATLLDQDSLSFSLECLKETWRELALTRFHQKQSALQTLLDEALARVSKEEARISTLDQKIRKTEEGEKLEARRERLKTRRKKLAKLESKCARLKREIQELPVPADTPPPAN